MKYLDSITYDKTRATLLILCGISLITACSNAPKLPDSKTSLPEPFVYLSDIDPSIVQELRYAGFHNFVGEPISGYSSARCILTRKAATGLAKVQQNLKARALGLKVYDCYRPQRAVDSFVKWAKDLKNVRMKAEFYPAVSKTRLFKDGYIDAKSGHSRGSTVDLTLVALPVTQQESYTPGTTLKACTNQAQSRFKDNSLDFGTGFDCFDPLSHTDNEAIKAVARQNRDLLKQQMGVVGFKNLPEEWWHFTLISEPFLDQYFDFEVK